MQEDEIQFCALCAPLEDAIDMINSGRLDAATALLERTLELARRLAAEKCRGPERPLS